MKMKNALKNTLVLVFAVASSGLAYASAPSPYLYLSGSTDSGQPFSLANGVSVGQQVWLDSAQQQANPYLTNFDFQYSAGASFQSGATLDIQFIKNDGSFYNGFATPNSVFFDSGAIDLNSLVGYTGYGFSWEDLYRTESGSSHPLGFGSPTPVLFSLPQTFTVVYTVSGLGVGDSFNLSTFSDSTQVGTNSTDVWVNNGSWQLLSDSGSQKGVIQDLGASPTPAPEPSVFGLGALGAALLTGLIKRRK